MELFVLYLWLKLDILTGLFVGLACLLVFVALGGAIWSSEPYYDDEKKNRKEVFVPLFKRKLLPGFILAIVAAVALPSKSDAAILIGGYYALKVVNTPEAGKVMSVLRKKANELLDAAVAK